MTGFRRPNPVFSDEYAIIRTALVAARQAAGLSQRQLAACLGKSASHVTLIERGQRRVDSLELFRIAGILSRDPMAFLTSIEVRLRAHDNRESAASDIRLP